MGVLNRPRFPCHTLRIPVLWKPHFPKTQHYLWGKSLCSGCGTRRKLTIISKGWNSAQVHERASLIIQSAMLEWGMIELLKHRFRVGALIGRKMFLAAGGWKSKMETMDRELGQITRSCSLNGPHCFAPRLEIQILMEIAKAEKLWELP